MPILSIQRFAQDHLICVEDICSRDIYCVDEATAVQDIRSIVIDSSGDWVLTTSNGSVVGATRRSTLLNALQYASPTLHINALIEVIPDKIDAKETLSPKDCDKFDSTAVSLVQDEDGTLIGLLDQPALERVRTRHMLGKEEQAKLLSDTIIQQIAQVTHDLSIEVYVIGGWVRDFILGLPNQDLDFAVVGDALHLANVLAERFGGVVHPFLEFGGAHWVVSDTLTVDFTGARKEEYNALGALPTVEPTHIERDLQRRDFSINAMAIAIHRNKIGLLLDPMNGLVDLKQGVLRTLHGLSFLQDPTRIFRAARYCTRFNLQLDDATLLQLNQATGIIRIGQMLTRTRIGIELEKIFEEVHPQQCWKQVCEWGVWTYWQPTWSSINLHSTSTLPYSFTSEDWQQCWWMQLRIALSGDESDDWKSMISIRPNGLKLWMQFPRQLESMRLNLQSIDLEKPHWERNVGDVLQKSTPTHWLLLESSSRRCIPFLEWWIEIGRRRIRHTTGDDILELGVPKGPKVAQLLQTAQHIAWEGGTAEDESAAIRTILSDGLTTMKKT